MLTRRRFLAGAGHGAAFTGLALSGLARPRSRTRDLGPLVPDEAGVLDLARGFEYVKISVAGEEMDDGFLVPALHDGMAAFPGPAPGKVLLVRNHEIDAGTGGGAFGEANELLGNFERPLLYDAGHLEQPSLGGTTTVLYDLATRRVERHFLSLAGTERNCAGGPTPWFSWITCEEDTGRAGDKHEKDHGYAFEVRADAKGPVEPVPLVAMGRFNREAIAVDPESGAVYQTEDREDGLFYRFLPDAPGELAKGGKLQALRVRGAPSLDTRNWSGFTEIPVREPFEVEWVDVEGPESPGDDLRFQGFLRGAARFARGEGVWQGAGAIWFCCTSGGRARKGQIWRYVPSAREGTRWERTERATLELFMQPDHPRLIDNCDNLCVTPWGDLFVCEDGPGEDRVLGVTPEGDVYPVARYAAGETELAGATFSPDGTTFFVNAQGPGITFAVTGPWERARQG